MTEAPPQYPMKRDLTCPFAPPPGMLELAAAKPLSRVTIWDGSTPWVVTGHAEQRALLSDPRISTDEHLPGFPLASEAMKETLAQRPKMIFNLDGPEHARFRRFLTKSFTFKRIQALRPGIQRYADELIDTMLEGPKPADLVQALALPLPSMMICELLGVPYEDAEFFQRNSSVGVDMRSSAEDSGAAIAALASYLIELVKTKTDHPAEDVMSDVAALVKDGEINEVEAGLLGLQVLVAGHETSSNMISLGTLALLQHPDALAQLRDAEEAVVAGAAEEMLRYLSVPHVGQRRIAIDDIEIGGETIRKGEGVMIDLPTGNWDATVFPDPDQLDLTRPTRLQQAFGFGPHQCIGQQLARAELQIVYGTLFRRVPTLALAGSIDEIAFKGEALAYGVEALPVTW